ncbi:hypothetical protein MLD38_003688 [Melastoma candidum]|uniref:Uncharacterized protein n=1 Tax=Melastoma candidum TaxID=119954 RepID=A0ACB9S331_9MYRT|nr:hypothetical protein MLD38_003688 [Melastoma candidum]
MNSVPRGLKPVRASTGHLQRHLLLLLGLWKANHVRLSSQDVKRGTFSHRRSVLHNQKTGKAVLPFRSQADFYSQQQLCQNLLLATMARVLNTRVHDLSGSFSKSSLSELDDVQGHPGSDKQDTLFKRLIKNQNDPSDLEGIRRLVLCSGKVYYELDEE